METRERRTATVSGWLALVVLLGGGIGLGCMSYLALGGAIRPRPNGVCSCNTKSTC
ncbi:MAG: hypothetical protein IH987_10985 [Planctomycetes bacterium]|nr:hypothetical protein [Planctomycetota bacterium]